jgi:hypothetical protein
MESVDKNEYLLRASLKTHLISRFKWYNRSINEKGANINAAWTF